ncbi:MAG: hypothetical protein ACFE0Q_01680 [Anaerolineae bacterium]
MTDKVPSSNPFNHLLQAENQQQIEQSDAHTEKSKKPKKDLRSRKSIRKKVRKYVNPLDGHSLNREKIELMSFELRNIEKKRVTADIPEAWRDELYQIAFDLKVGRYEFLGYILGSFLGKTRSDD